ncbi:hypothetical protein [Methanobacterium sp.]|uniref:hypothetical protein n=1 Tax=Methanobacterium sp. TaxID=2164 RepID=UPI003C7450FC
MDKIKRTKKHVLYVYNNYSKLPKMLKSRPSEQDINPNYKLIEIKEILPEECLMGSNKNCINTWSAFSREIICKELLFFIKTIKNETIKTTYSNNNISYINCIIQDVTQDLLDNGFVPDLIIIPHDLYVKLRSRYNIPNGYLEICGIRMNVIHSSKCQNLDEIILVDTDTISSVYKPEEKTDEKLWINITKIHDEQLDISIIRKINTKIIDSNGIEIIKIKD